MNQKSREGNGVVVRADVVEDLKLWLADKLTALQAEARRRFKPIPAEIPPGTPVVDVPAGLVRIFDRDLTHAGIPKRDEWGRTLDVHALRTTFGALLSRGGVPLRTAQAAMRHSDPSLTANVYTDPRLLDVSGALGTLPTLPLDAGPPPSREHARATGTDAAAPFSVALTHGNGTESGAIPDKTNNPGRCGAGADRIDVSALNVKEKDLLATPDIFHPSVGAAGFEPTTSRPPV